MWVEILVVPSKSILMIVSHSEWVRGLKYTVCEWMSIQIVSHPEWVCGLKFRYYTEKKISTYIAPFVGARIEMQQILRETTSERSHPEWVCGLKFA